MSLLTQPDGHPALSEIRSDQVLLVDHSHQSQVEIAVRHRLVIQRTARQTQQIALLTNTQGGMRPINPLPPLTQRALLLFF